MIFFDVKQIHESIQVVFLGCEEIQLNEQNINGIFPWYPPKCRPLAGNKALILLMMLM